MSFELSAADPAAYEREFRKIVKPLVEKESSASDATRPYLADAVRASLWHDDSVMLARFLDVNKASEVRKGVRVVRFGVDGRSIDTTINFHDRSDADEDALSSSSPVQFGYSLFYRMCWMFIGLAGLVWGVVVGGSALGAGWVGLTTAVAGTIGVVGLMATLFVAGRRSQRAS